MSARREFATFALVLGLILGGFLGECLFGGKVLSSADVLFVSGSFRQDNSPSYEPLNRLLMDPALQFEPWLEFNRAMFRRGRLPLWNDLAGCGAPHLANGQSAPFDPLNLIAYVGALPDARAWIAAARLWFAGLGMFLLARLWGLGGWGRWFSGLSYPLCGFMMVWLLFPVTNVAVWTPWLFWASQRLLDSPGRREVGVVSLVTGLVFLGGHIQTSAHVLMAAGAYVGWCAMRGFTARGLAHWSSGVVLGLTLASASIVPLWFYLGKSSVWSDREYERPSAGSITRPRWLDAICTAVPYAFGSQRRGHPNLARALGVHNLNESAGGFIGLAGLVWLAPQAWRVRSGNARVPFLAGMAIFGFLGAFGFPPVANLLRAAPVLNVTDPRRFTLWVAFSLVVLGGIGLDGLAMPWPSIVARWWILLGLAGAGAMALAAAGIPASETWLRERANSHYSRAAAVTEGSDPILYQARADRQVNQTLRHLPRVLALTAIELCVLAGAAVLAHRGRLSWNGVKAGLIGLTVGELFLFGYGLNPAIAREDERPVVPVIAYLKENLGAYQRVVGLGEELPPNVAMRYGLADARNYDSVEVARSRDWFTPLYEPTGNAVSSRATSSWAGVVRARERLREAGVAAVVASSPPPSGLSDHVERIGAVWVARLAAAPIAETIPKGGTTSFRLDNGLIHVKTTCADHATLIVRQTYDSGWRAEVDGRPAAVLPHLGTFLSVKLESGEHRIDLVYDPPEVRAACAGSIFGLAATVFALSGIRPRGSLRIRGKGLDGTKPSG